MSTMTRMRGLRIVVAASAIALLAAPLSAGAQTDDFPDFEASATFDLTAVDTSASSSGCLPAGVSLLNDATPATFVIGDTWFDSGYSEGNSFDYNTVGPMTGLFDTPLTIPAGEMAAYWDWDPATGAVTNAGFSSGSISGGKIGGEDVVITISSGPGGESEGTGTLTKNADGSLVGSIDYEDFELSIDFSSNGLTLGNGCRFTAETFSLVFGAPAPAPTPALNLVLDFAVGDSIRAGNLPVTTAGGGLKANAPYTVVLRSDPVQIGQGNTDDEGSFTNTSPLPADTPGGSHSVTVASTAPDGTAVEGVAYFTIDDNGVVTAISYDAATPLAPATAAAATPQFTG